MSDASAINSSALLRCFTRAGGARKYCEALKERGILIKNVAKVHPLLEGCLRTTIGTTGENDALMQALRAIMEGSR